MNPSSLRALCTVVLAFTSFSACAANIAYISSSSGYMLHNSGGTAVTAGWNGQAPLQSFAGYGQINLGGQCLTGENGGQPLRWEGCRGGNKAQVWALNGSKLNNELGWCADVEGNRSGAGVRVLAYRCSGAVNQQWKSHSTQSAQSLSAAIQNPAQRAAFTKWAASAQAGDRFDINKGVAVPSGGGNAVAAGGANVIAAGGGNVVAAGGLN